MLWQPGRECNTSAGELKWPSAICANSNSEILLSVGLLYLYSKCCSTITMVEHSQRSNELDFSLALLKTHLAVSAMASPSH